MIKSKYTSAITDNPWWLAGGIPAANCMAAYRAKGAESYASSLVNLVTPGLYDAYDDTNTPPWTSALGWQGVHSSGKYLKTILVPKIGWSMAIKIASVVDWAGGIAASMQYGWGFDIGGGKFIATVGGGQITIKSSAGSTTGVAIIANKNIYWNTEYINASTGTTDYSTALYLMSPSSKIQTFEGYLQAVAVYNNELTQAQATELTRAMNAL